MATTTITGSGNYGFTSGESDVYIIKDGVSGVNITDNNADQAVQDNTTSNDLFVVENLTNTTVVINDYATVSGVDKNTNDDLLYIKNAGDGVKVAYFNIYTKAEAVNHQGGVDVAFVSTSANATGSVTAKNHLTINASGNYDKGAGYIDNVLAGEQKVNFNYNNLISKVRTLISKANTALGTSYTSSDDLKGTAYEAEMMALYNGTDENKFYPTYTIGDLSVNSTTGPLLTWLYPVDELEFTQVAGTNEVCITHGNVTQRLSYKEATFSYYAIDRSNNSYEYKKIDDTMIASAKNRAVYELSAEATEPATIAGANYGGVWFRGVTSQDNITYRRDYNNLIMSVNDGRQVTVTDFFADTNKVVASFRNDGSAAGSVLNDNANVEMFVNLSQFDGTYKATEYREVFEGSGVVSGLNALSDKVKLTYADVKLSRTFDGDNNGALTLTDGTNTIKVNDYFGESYVARLIYDSSDPVGAGKSILSKPLDVTLADTENKYTTHEKFQETIHGKGIIAADSIGVAGTNKDRIVLDGDATFTRENNGDLHVKYGESDDITVTDFDFVGATKNINVNGNLTSTESTEIAVTLTGIIGDDYHSASGYAERITTKTSTAIQFAENSDKDTLVFDTTADNITYRRNGNNLYVINKAGEDEIYTIIKGYYTLTDMSVAGQFAGVKVDTTSADTTLGNLSVTEIENVSNITGTDKGENIYLEKLTEGVIPQNASGDFPNYDEETGKYTSNVLGNREVKIDAYAAGMGGDDVIYGTEGNDWINGGDGNDLIVGGASGKDMLAGGDGQNEIYAGTFVDNKFKPNEDGVEIYGGKGLDMIYAGGKDTTENYIWAHGGDDVINLYGGKNTIMLVEDNGSSYGNDTIVGATANDTLKFVSRLDADTTVGAKFEDMSFTKDGDDLKITVGGDVTTIDGFFTANSKVDTILTNDETGTHYIKRDAVIDVEITEAGEYSASDYKEAYTIASGIEGNVIIHNLDGQKDSITLNDVNFDDITFFHRDGRLDMAYGNTLVLLAGYDSAANKLSSITTSDGTYGFAVGNDATEFTFSTESTGNNIIIGALDGDKLNFTDIDANKVLYTRNAYGDLVVTVKEQAGFAVTLKGFFSADVHKYAHLDTIKFNDSVDVSILNNAEINVNADSYFLGYNVVNDAATEEVGGYKESIVVTSGNLSKINIDDAVLNAISSGDITKTHDDTGYHYTLALGKDKELASIIVGQLGDDTIYDSEGNDYLAGANGDDTIISTKGEDALIGGAGDDNLYADKNTSDVEIYGGAGDDEITSGSGNDFIWGGAGNDEIHLNGGNNRIILSDNDFGSDTIYNATANDKLEFVLRQDGEVVQGHDFDELTFAKKGNDLEISAGSSKATINGFFTATSKVDTILTKDGEKSIKNDAVFDVVLDSEHPTFNKATSGYGDYRVAVSGNGSVSNLGANDKIATSGQTVKYMRENDGGLIVCATNDGEPTDKITVTDFVFDGAHDINVNKGTTEGMTIDVTLTGALEGAYVSAAGYAERITTIGDSSIQFYPEGQYIGQDTLVFGTENITYKRSGDDLVITHHTDEYTEISTTVLDYYTSDNMAEEGQFARAQVSAGEINTTLGDLKVSYIENVSNITGTDNEEAIELVTTTDVIPQNASGDFPNYDGETGKYTSNVLGNREVKIDAYAAGMGGDDLIEGTEGNDWINGGDGNDTIYGGTSGKDMLAGGDGENTILAGDFSGATPAPNTDGVEIYGGKDKDTIYAGGNSSTENYIWAHGGNDVINLYGGKNTIMLVEDGADATAGNDTIYGATSLDTLKFVSRDGDGKVIKGFAVKDLSFAKSGDGDLIITTSDNSTVTIKDYFETAEADRVKTFMTTDGTLTLEWKHSNVENADYMYNVTSNTEKNLVEGIRNWVDGYTTEPVSVTGTSAGDMLAGSIKDDTITASDGGAELYGDKGNDTLIGGAGADYIRGKEGNDTLTGNGGADVFAIDSGNDVITDATSADVIKFVDDYRNDFTGITFAKGEGEKATSLMVSFGENSSVEIQNYFNADGTVAENHVNKFAIVTEEGTKEYTLGWHDGAMYNEIRNTDDKTITAVSGIQNWIDGQSKDASGKTITGGDKYDMLAGTQNADTITAGANGAEIYGDGGADTITATNSFIVGGSGIDTINVSGGNNTILFLNTPSLNPTENDSYATGTDTVNGATSGDVLKFAYTDKSVGYSVADLSFAKDGDNLVITAKKDATHENTVILTDFFESTDNVDKLWTTDGEKSIKDNALINVVLTNGEAFDASLGGYNYAISGNGSVSNLGANDKIAMSGTTEYSFNDKGLLVEDGTNEITISDNTTGQTANVYVNGNADNITGKTLTVTKLNNFDATGLSYKNVEITGTDSADNFTGSTGDDTIYGKAGADVINGGAGKDNIQGGAGDDTIDGGTGADTFMYEANGTSFGHDTIKNATADDVINFSIVKDTITFDGGIKHKIESTAKFSDLVFEKSGNDLLIKIKDNTADDIKVEGFFTAGSKIDKIFAAENGTYSNTNQALKEYSIKTDAVINVEITQAGEYSASDYKEAYTIASGIAGNVIIHNLDGQKDSIKLNGVDFDDITFFHRDGRLDMAYGSTLVLLAGYDSAANKLSSITTSDGTYGFAVGNDATEFSFSTESTGNNIIIGALDGDKLNFTNIDANKVLYTRNAYGDLVVTVEDQADFAVTLKGFFSADVHKSAHLDTIKFNDSDDDVSILKDAEINVNADSYFLGYNVVDDAATAEVGGYNEIIDVTSGNLSKIDINDAVLNAISSGDITKTLDETGYHYTLALGKDKELASIIVGQLGDDTIYDSEGNDYLAGANGDDKIYSTKGEDALIGGAGADYLYAKDNTSDVEIYGGAGNDEINSGSGNDFIWGGSGNDDIILNGGNNRIILSDNDFGSDTIYNATANDKLEFVLRQDGEVVQGHDFDELTFVRKNADLEIFVGNNSKATISGFFNAESPVDIIIAEDGTYSIKETEINVVLTNGETFDASGDYKYAISGNGSVTNLGDNDRLVFASVTDYALDKSEGWTISDQNGNSITVMADEKIDLPNVYVGEASDDITGKTLKVTGFSTFNASEVGFEKYDITGTDKADTLIGGDGADTIKGGKGDDTIYGGAGNDDLTGGEGKNTIYTGTGDDDVDATEGANTIYVDGYGHKEINSGSTDGNTFVFSKGTAVINYATENDTIKFATFDPSKVEFVKDGYNLVIRSLVEGDEDTITIGDYFNGHAITKFVLGETETTLNLEWKQSNVDGEYHMYNVITGDYTTTDPIEAVPGIRNWINAGPNKNNVIGADQKDMLAGNANDDVIVASNPAEIFGGDGDDVIYALGGDSFVAGGLGDDTITVSGGNNTIALVDTWRSDDQKEKEFGADTVTGAVKGDVLKFSVDYGPQTGTDPQFVGYTFDDLYVEKDGTDLIVYAGESDEDGNLPNNKVVLTDYFTQKEEDRVSAIQALVKDGETYTQKIRPDELTALVNKYIYAPERTYDEDKIEAVKGQIVIDKNAEGGEYKINAAEYVSETTKGITVNNKNKSAGLDVTGSLFNDTITTKNDVSNTIIENGGTNKITTGNADDVVIAGDYSNNTINVGKGDNTVTLESTGINKVTASNGNNDVNVYAGSNNIKLGNGANEIGIAGGVNTVKTGKGANTVLITDGVNKVTTGKGKDGIIIAGGNNTISSGVGEDVYNIVDGYNTIKTGNAATTFNISDSYDIKDGDVTVATVEGDGGVNVITSGSKNDTFNIDAGVNTIKSGSGVDTFYLNGGTKNIVDAGAGNDNFNINAGTNYLNGAAGNDNYIVNLTAENGFDFENGDILITDTKGKNVLDLTMDVTGGTRDALNLFFDVDLKTKKNGDVIVKKNNASYTYSTMTFTTDDIDENFDGDAVGIDVSSKKSISTVKINGTEYAINTKEIDALAQEVANWLNTNNFASTTEAFADETGKDLSGLIAAYTKFNDTHFGNPTA